MILLDQTDQPVKVTERRHHEWVKSHLRWRFLLDSFEGGEAYRTAIYGTDLRGMPVRNLIRHKREYPEAINGNGALYNNRYFDRIEGSDQYTAANDDDYSLRLARTPVPSILPSAIEAHLSAVYAEEVIRTTDNEEITEWWNDVDGCGTKIDYWMAETVAPLLQALGCLDLICDHPKAPDGAEIQSQADIGRYDLDRCIAGFILPENMVWWQLDDLGCRYVECLVCELADNCWNRNYRHWTAQGWTLYDDNGMQIDQGTHPFGEVPIRRVFAGRKRPHMKNVGLPPYEVLAEIQREFYNRDSELILSDTTQAHPLLQGPEDYIQADGTIPVGPSWLMPMKKNSTGTTTTYQGFAYVDAPKSGAESIRTNLHDLDDRADRAASLTKPAGASMHKGTVGQSGASKRIDQSAGNKRLGKIAAVMERTEQTLVELVELVLSDGKVDVPSLTTVVNYPRQFDLMTAEEVAKGTADFQTNLAVAGECPLTEGRLLKRQVRLLLPGLDDADYTECDDEIDKFLIDKASAAGQLREAGGNMTQDSGDTSGDSSGSQPGSGGLNPSIIADVAAIAQRAANTSTATTQSGSSQSSGGTG